MLELFFITSNPTKLAHLSYIGRKLGIKIIGFRQRTYYGSYNEPDSDDRELVLNRSYESALRQVERAGLPGSALFFFEDTSVNIDSLSRRGEEYPGTRIKYWMQEHNFEDLDAALGRKSRRASIRSDLVLHLPAAYRSYSKINEPYFHCSGRVSGHIAAAPSIARQANPLYPWLDPRSFSGWFVPEDANYVLSDLEINEADKYDFRLRSFSQLQGFLSSLHLIEPLAIKPPVQEAFSFAPRRKIVIFLGQTCAGKTTAARALSDGGQFIHLEASDFMRAELVRRHGPRTTVPVKIFAEKALKEQPWIVPDQLVEIIRRFDKSNFVISGLRSPLEVDLIIGALGGESVEVAWIDAPSRTRFNRAKVRGRDGFSNSYKAFKDDDRSQLAMGLAIIKQHLQRRKLDNKSSLDHFISSIKERFDIDSPESWEEKRFAFEEMLTHMQRRLILALGAMGGESAFFTSGQVADFTNDEQNPLFPTEKDNISRFFTQASYPFFEMKKQGSGTAVKLSNTGLSIYRVLALLGSKVRDKGREVIK